MTENKNQDQQLDRGAAARVVVSSLITNAYSDLYRAFDDLAETHQITAAEVVEALNEMHEEEIREHYAHWADIDIREDGADTDPMAVPDPYDASSYNTLRAQSPIGEEFTGWDILRQLIDEFPHSYVDQTGGGTATLVIRKSEVDVAITAGPGSYNWSIPKSSIFYSGDFNFGRDPYDNDGNEYPDDVPAEFLSPENPGTIEQLVQRIRTAYAKYNTEGPSAK